MSRLEGLGGPVSMVLEAELRERVRQKGIVVWLDGQGDYMGFVDRLSAQAARLPYKVRAWRGSHLRLMLDLEGLADGLEPPRLLIHLPHHNEEEVKRTPLLELYKAGVRHRKKLETLISESAARRVAPERIAAFIHEGSLTLEKADAWLASLLDEHRGDLDAQLRAMTLEATIKDLLSGGLLAQRVNHEADRAALWRQLEAWTGLPADWRDVILPSHAEPRADDIAFAASSWALCVEYVADLGREPKSKLLRPARGLPKAVVAACGALAAHLRAHQKAFYTRSADEAEALIEEEIGAARAEELGAVDTFRFEENRILDDALAALESASWEDALRWATGREGSFWIEGDPHRRSAWRLIEVAASLGQRIEEAPSKNLKRLDLLGVITRYTEVGASVDRAHRQLVQERLKLLHPQVPHFERLRASLDALRGRWRAWADAWAEGFSAICESHGFLPEPSLQQRTLFDEVVRPMTDKPGVTAFFVIDALRFEMGQALAEELGRQASTSPRLEPRLCELPSVTEIGMNALAPVARKGRVKVHTSKGNIQGLSAGEFRVHDPKSRQKAMHARVGGETCPWLSLDEVLERKTSSLKRALGSAHLVVVHSTEIDEAGENGVGPTVFERALQRIRAAWEILRGVDVRRFVITSDHGFLLLEGDKAPITYGRKIDPKRRYVLSATGADLPSAARIPLSALNYEVEEALHLLVPKDTAVFDTGNRGGAFVHGGNSLQERLIPVLILEHRSPKGGGRLSYRVEAEAGGDVADMHALSGRVLVEAQGGLSFGGRRELELGLEVIDAPEVRVELCHIRGAAQLRGGGLHVEVEQPFEVFFKLLGAQDARVRVRLRHMGSAAEVQPLTLEARFAVSTLREAAPPAPEMIEAPQPEPKAKAWLEALPEGGVRAFFEHLALHGTINEAEGIRILGSPRKMRSFSLRFESYAAKAPFSIRVDTAGGGKCYVREGALPPVPRPASASRSHSPQGADE